MPSCSFPESSITATTESVPTTTQSPGPNWAELAPNGGGCTITGYPDQYEVALVNGQLVSSAAPIPTLDKWALSSYSLGSASIAEECIAVIKFTCPGCAGVYTSGSHAPCDAMMEVWLTLPAQ